MESKKLKSATERIANVMIIALIIIGTVAFALVNQMSEGGELMSKIFLAFLGAIITVQLIPGLILLGAMLKGVAAIGRKKEAAAEASSDPYSKH